MQSNLETINPKNAASRGLFESGLDLKVKVTEINFGSVFAFHLNFTAKLWPFPIASTGVKTDLRKVYLKKVYLFIEVTYLYLVCSVQFHVFLQQIYWQPSACSRLLMLVHSKIKERK